MVSRADTICVIFIHRKLYFKASGRGLFVICGVCLNPNAFSSWLDASPPWDMTEDADSGYVVANVVRVRVQEFIRTALSSRPCSIPPLVVNVDDYLGPLHNSILGELSYKTTLTQLAKWYDTVAISYAEVVRDIAYANTADKTFFNEKDVHFGYSVIISFKCFMS